MEKYMTTQCTANDSDILKYQRVKIKALKFKYPAGGPSKSGVALATFDESVVSTNDPVDESELRDELTPEEKEKFMCRKEGEELRAAAVQHRETVELRSRLSASVISAEQINNAARDAQSKLYQHRTGFWIPQIWLAAADCGMQGRMIEVAVLVSPESLHAAEAAQPHRH
eukprot:jgi/Tetstr1/436479/TSEL_025307.t1